MSDVKKEAVSIVKGVAEAATGATIDQSVEKVTTKLEADAAKSKSDWVKTRNATETVAVNGLAGYLKNLISRWFKKL